ncbi:MAG: hypothetical protein A2150_05950 [Candidatus Muproteobacteria bacterium RBG_16_64_11]|uniref:Phage holin family protein n=1 Tax=Candidatus Muproteobacteria bacterium RBG_16_64_11 TaxID=1817758 RepID=A0A1F6TIC5_9PROT|nr:MAG: hypothetical protein A2150_05950 [Candidatus Muproteobacteria bacterium RBG_16_64_11]
MREAEGTPSGLLASLQRLVAALLEILQTRLEIVATEFEEERERIRELVLFGFLALFFTSFGLLLLTLFIVVLFWDTHRLYVLGGFTLLYLTLGFIAGAVLRQRLRTRPRLFAATLAELSKDRERLTPDQT